jgi:hypothetical protein
LFGLREWEEALDEQEITLRTQEYLLGDGHADTVISRYTLSGIYHSLGRFQEADDLLHKVINDQERLYGSASANTTSHPIVLRSRARRALESVASRKKEHRAARVLYLGMTLAQQSKFLSYDRKARVFSAVTPAAAASPSDTEDMDSTAATAPASATGASRSPSLHGGGGSSGSGGGDSSAESDDYVVVPKSTPTFSSRSSTYVSVAGGTRSALDDCGGRKREATESSTSSMLLSSSKVKRNTKNGKAREQLRGDGGVGVGVGIVGENAVGWV